MKSSQSALEPLELEPLELRLLPELELSLATTPGDVVSAAAERSARAMKRSLLMASMEPYALSRIFNATLRHVYGVFEHLRNERSLEAWAPHFKDFAKAIHRGGRRTRRALEVGHGVYLACISVRSVCVGVGA